MSRPPDRGIRLLTVALLVLAASSFTQASHSALETTLTDTRAVSMTVAADLLEVRGHTVAQLPAAATAGRLAVVTDSTRGLWTDTGTQWYSLTADVADVRAFGAVGGDSTDDTSAFAAARDGLPSAGGVVVVPPGTFVLSGFRVTPGVTVRLTEGSVIVPPASSTASMFRVDRGGVLEGGVIDVRDKSFSGVAVEVVAAAPSPNPGDHRRVVRDLTIKGDTGAGSGTGVLVRASDAGHAVWGLTIEGIRTRGFEYAIRFDCTAGYINSNVVQDVFVNEAVYGVHMNEGGTCTGLDENTFRDVRIQSSAHAVRGFVIDGDDLVFDPVATWDFGASDTSVDIRSGASKVQVRGRLDGLVSDSGSNNFVMNLRNDRLPVKQISLNVEGINLDAVAAHSTTETEFGFTNAAAGDAVIATPSAALAANCMWGAYVSGTALVRIRIANLGASSSDCDGAGGVTWRVTTLKYGAT